MFLFDDEFLRQAETAQFFLSFRGVSFLGMLLACCCDLDWSLIFALSVMNEVVFEVFSTLGCSLSLFALSSLPYVALA